MEILSFEIEGKFAHFRKFQGNNTAMSYSIPPRTTIIGILAAIMGEEKNSYYEKYQHINLMIGVRCMSEVKKSFHRLNLLMIKGKDDFRGGKGRVQTPFEIVTGYDLKKDSVKYKFYLTAGKDTSIYNGLKTYLQGSERKFNLSLGIAGFSAYISNVQINSAVEKSAVGEWLNLHSAGNSDQIDEIDFKEDAAFRFNHLEEELMPADFIGGEKGREVFRMNRVLFATVPLTMRIKLSGKFYQTVPADKNDSENIQFLEYASIFSQQKD